MLGYSGLLETSPAESAEDLFNLIRSLLDTLFSLLVYIYNQLELFSETEQTRFYFALFSRGYYLHVVTGLALLRRTARPATPYPSKCSATRIHTLDLLITYPAFLAGVS